MSSNFKIVVTNPAKKEFAQLDKSNQKRITLSLALLGQNPRPRGARKVVAPEPLLRIRVGDYRVIYAVRDQELLILVVSINRRKDVYRELS